MSLLVWNPEWETGVPVIDAQHRELLARVERLMVALRADRAQPLLPELLDYLVDYADAHFREEEQQMEATAYPDLQEHAGEHARMRAEVVDLAARHQQGQPALSEQVLDFLTDWLVRHINDHDRRMARYLLHGAVGSEGAGR